MCLGGAVSAVSVGVAWLDLSSFEQYVWFCFASARGASGHRPRGVPAEASDQPAAVAHQLAVGRLVNLAPDLNAARGDMEQAARRGQRTRVEAGCARANRSPRCCGSASISRTSTSPSIMDTSRVWPSPSRTVRVAAMFLPVGLSVGVATSSASPSQLKDSGTRYGAPSAEALATQTSMSWVSRCSVSRRRWGREREVGSHRS